MFKKYKKIIITLLFVLSSISSYAFRLDNIIFNQRIDGPDGGYRESYIVNDSLEKVRYKISVLPGNEKDGSKYVQVYPRVITVEPKSKGVVKIYAKAPSSIEKGEYHFKLQFKPIVIPTLAKAKDGKITGTANIQISPIIDMKGYAGEIDFKNVIKFEDIKVENNLNGKGIIVTGKLSNDSFAGIDFGAEAYGFNDFFYGAAYIGNVEKETKNKFIKLSFSQIKKPSDLKKIIFYRTPSNKREIIKEITINQ
ncbi:hypothetical protein [Fusobacterium sp.]|uniref:hypothetical protein n=1 Tax=Fusobacterium sp. TaxID=68766 RepID=UPI000C70501A|nr:hypothetical protein [Fusobacterium sp.]